MRGVSTAVGERGAARAAGGGTVAAPGARRRRRQSLNGSESGGTMAAATLAAVWRRGAGCSRRLVRGCGEDRQVVALVGTGGQAGGGATR